MADSNRKLFGYQIQYLMDVIDARNRPFDAGIDDSEKRVKLAEQFSRVVMQVVVSLIVILGCFTVIFYKPNDTVHKAAFTTIGVILGYWLR